MSTTRSGTRDRNGCQATCDVLLRSRFLEVHEPVRKVATG